MSNEANIVDPAALDLATVDQLIGELRRRHQSLIVCAFPFPRARETPKADFAIYGSYHICLGMAVDATRKIQSQEGT